MKKNTMHALAPMLSALKIKQSVSFEDCNALFSEMHSKTCAVPPAFELSGNQWAALMNLAVARYGVQPATAKDARIAELQGEAVVMRARIAGLEAAQAQATQPQELKAQPPDRKAPATNHGWQTPAA